MCLSVGMLLRDVPDRVAVITEAAEACLDDYMIQSSSLQLTRIALPVSTPAHWKWDLMSGEFLSTVLFGGEAQDVPSALTYEQSRKLRIRKQDDKKAEVWEISVFKYNYCLFVLQHKRGRERKTHLVLNLIIFLPCLFVAAPPFRQVAENGE